VNYKPFAPVSCVITCHNNSATIKRAIMSVVKQSLPVGEIIVSDDASTDGSQSIISDLARTYTKINAIFHDRQLGVSENRNFAFSKAKFNVLTQLDGDDLFDNKKIEQEWSTFSRHPDSIVFSSYVRINPHRWWCARVVRPLPGYQSGDSAFTHMLATVADGPRDYMLSRSALEEVGGYDPLMSLYEDWEISLRLAKTGRAWKYSGGIGTIYTLHGTGLSSVGKDRHEAVVKAVREKYGYAGGHETPCAKGRIRRAGNMWKFHVKDRLMAIKDLPWVMEALRG
jgi:glycosyltransferase involved in cell wall biosynthesis